MASSTVKQPLDAVTEVRLRDVAEHINGIVESMFTVDTDKKQKKAAANNILSMLEEEGLCYTEWAEPKRVGCHPDNRFGQGVDAHDCHELHSKIMQNGFSHDGTLNCAIEVAQDSEKYEAQMKFQEALGAESGG
eukprot:5145390-Pyramimonas_sp.AAC.1